MQDEATTRGKMRLVALAGMAFALSFALGGCHKKTVVPPLPAITQPVDLATAPPLETEITKVSPVSQSAPVASAAEKPHRERRRSTPRTSASTPPTEVAAAEAPSPAPEETAIGNLSTGGDSSPRAQQEASDLIASIEKRLNALTAQKAEAEKTQISKIKNFQRQAQDALTSGDAEGAKTLATKAKLLLDDLEK
jgi:ribosomal protein S20